MVAFDPYGVLSGEASDTNNDEDSLDSGDVAVPTSRNGEAADTSDLAPGLYGCKIRTSKAYGQGLFAIKRIRKGQIVATAEQPVGTIGDKRSAFDLPIFKMINHSCRPTAELFHTNQDSTVRAIQDIQNNQQILITKVTPYLAKQERSEALDFDCRCMACKLPDDKVDQDEDMRALIRRSADALTALWASCRPMLSGGGINESSGGEVCEAVVKPDWKGTGEDCVKIFQEDLLGKLGPQHSDSAIFYEVAALLNLVRIAAGERDLIHETVEILCELLTLVATNLGMQHEKALEARTQLDRIAKGSDAERAAALVGQLEAGDRPA